MVFPDTPPQAGSRQPRQGCSWACSPLRRDGHWLCFFIAVSFGLLEEVVMSTRSVYPPLEHQETAAAGGLLVPGWKPHCRLGFHFLTHQTQTPLWHNFSDS